MLLNHLEGILNYCRTKVPLGMVEAILDSLRRLDWASRDMRRRHKAVEAAARDLATALGRAPTEAEVAEKLGMDVTRFRTIMIDRRNVGLFSASTSVPKDEELPAPDFPDKPEGQPDRITAGHRDNPGRGLI